jgi:hypothetical protein
MNKREKIASKLRLLSNIGAIVTASDENKTIYVQYETLHSFDFEFIWSRDHFIGYSITKKRQLKRPKQAILSLWSSKNAARFVDAYKILIRLRAKR